MLKKSLIAAALCAKMVLAAYAFNAPLAQSATADHDAGYWPEPSCAPGESCWS